MKTNYAEMAKKAMKEKSAILLKPIWFEFKKKGDSIIGRLIAKVEVEGTSFPGTFIKYQLETDGGPAEFKIGQASDKDTGAFMEVGQIYSVTYSGDEETGKGSPRHCYDVFHIPSDDLPF